MSTLTGKTVANTYKDLIHLGNAGNGIHSGEVKSLLDGNGDSIPIAVQGATISTGNKIIIGGGQYSSEVSETVTLSGNNIVAYASGGAGSVDIKGDTVSIAATGLSLTFGSLSESGGGVLTSDPETYSTLLWHGSGGVDEKVLTQSYEELSDIEAANNNNTIAMSDAAVSEIRIDGNNSVMALLPTGTPGQTKTIIIKNNNLASGNVFEIGNDPNTAPVLNFGENTGHTQLVKDSDSWVVLLSSTT